MNKEWFENWFDTKYYHILYKNRDYSEAERFIENLISFLKPQPKAKIIDIACGKGRHSIFLNKKGFNVVGFDLSFESIQDASLNARPGLEFYVHDMRQIFRTNYFDFGFNLFTSFGYFKSQRDERNAMLANAKNLKAGGTLVIDFFNREKVISTLVPYEEKLIDGINFKISKEISENRVTKTIEFTDEGHDYKFQESVKLLSKKDFEGYLTEAGMKISSTFGNYNLDALSAESDRLIIVAEKLG